MKYTLAQNANIIRSEQLQSKFEWVLIGITPLGTVDTDIDFDVYVVEPHSNQRFVVDVLVPNDLATSLAKIVYPNAGTGLKCWLVNFPYPPQLEIEMENQDYSFELSITGLGLIG